MRRANWIFAAVALLTAACSDAMTSAGTGAGTLVMRLTTPHTDDGALLFELSGPSIDNVIANDESLRLFTRRDGGSIVGAIVGTLSTGAIVTMRVPDVSAAASYTATIREVADRQDALRASLAGYALTVTR